MKVVVFGGAGLVGSRFLELHSNSFDFFAPTAQELDFTDQEKTKKFLEEKKPDVLINFAAITNVEGSEEEKDNKEGATYKVNSLAVKNLSEICKELSVHLIQISTEYVFDGRKESPYTEEDTPSPINWYGATKYFAEKFIQESGVSFTIMRIAMPFSSHYEIKKDIARVFLERLQSNQEITAIKDCDISPTFVDDIANALKVLAEKKPSGIYQCVSSTTTTPYKFAKLIAKEFGLNEDLVKEVSFDEYNKNKKAKLLKHSWMSNKKFIEEFDEGILHSVEESIEEFKRQLS